MIKQMTAEKPIIGITIGDPAGIGPEISVMALSRKEVYNYCRPILLGDADVIINASKLTNSDLRIKVIEDLSNTKYENGTIDVIDFNNVNKDKLELGKVSAPAGKAAFEYIHDAIQLAMNGKIDAVVTGPINKESLNLAGYKYSGHTEIFAQYTNTKKYAMLLVDEDLRIIHVSTHVSLRDACGMVKKERILEVIELLNTACLQFGIENPRIGVASLNPHASDGGLFGDEEENEIIPAISEAFNKGYNVTGPFPPDTLFPKAKAGSFDGCVAMYHDQGHIPFKLSGFEWDKDTEKMKSVKGINVTLGLPIIRTSVDHGTAFEIAGKGIASPDAMLMAIKYASQLAIVKN
ncbi:4-hydroxythreonine-4-phosphate dehydrogenase PdxA [Bacteroidota bacterium]